MRATTGTPYGFLGPNESLLEVLASDNEFVLRQGLGHADFAQVLNNIYFMCMAWRNGSFSTTIAGTQYAITVTSHKGEQFSPFGDEASSGIDMRIQNSSNGVSISVPGLLPHLIWKYGFYEGFGSAYRVSPEDLLSFFSAFKKTQ